MFLISAQINAYMIYISTDYVFDGTSPPYDEDSKPNPLNNYGKLKFEGEKAVQDELKSKTDWKFRKQEINPMKN